MFDKSQIPFLGSGIGFRPEIKPDIFLNKDKIDFVEIIAEHYIDCSKEKLYELEILIDEFIVIPHAVDLSIGSAEGVNHYYLKKLSKLIKKIDPPYWSEHLSFSKANGINLGHLSPLPFNKDSIDIITNNLKVIREKISHPLILENITYTPKITGQFSEVDFLNSITTECDCGLLLDVTNLYINSVNHNYNVDYFLNNINVESIIQLHYVGYTESKNGPRDTHSKNTSEEIFNLLQKTIQKTSPKGVLLERDRNFPDDSNILFTELMRARSFF